MSKIKVKYRGPKIVNMRTKEIQECIRNAKAEAKHARAVIVIITRQDGTGFIQSTHADRYETLLKLEQAKSLFSACQRA